MCSNRLCSKRRNKMNPEGQQPAQALKRKKTRRLKKRRPQDGERFSSVEVPNKRAKRGQMAAPENTTQFLMEDREKFEPFNLDAACSPSYSPVSSCSRSTSSIRGSPANETDFEYLSEFVEDFDQLYFEKDFNDFYDNIYAETLLSLTKQELITRYLDLEKKEEELLKQVRVVNDKSTNVSPLFRFEGLSSKDSDGFTGLSTENEKNARNKDQEKNMLKVQVQELRLLNSQLAQENEKLRGC